ncbi:MAG: hypothetical protein MJ147_02070 [Clostridia bacterium]|nr:hypothetical protein [Clostridia bacterium]
MAVSTIDAVVEYGGNVKEYTTFSSAWNAATNAAKYGNNVVFKLCKDWNSSGIIYCNFDGDITIDLNGHAINRNISAPKNGGEVICAESNLTIIDSNHDNASSYGDIKGGIITGGANTSAGGAICVHDSATVNIKGITILNCVSTDEGGAIAIDSENATVNIEDVAFYNNRTYDASTECYGGAIYNDGGTLNIKNSLFEGNYSEDDGGAIYDDGGKLNIKDTTFYFNSSNEEGGALFLNDTKTDSIDRCTFKQNTANEDGGAVYVESVENNAFFNECKMHYNDAKENGGAVYINCDKVFLNSGEYTKNTAGENGGGIYVDSMNDVNAYGKLIVSDNTVNGKQNDLCLQNGTFSEAYIYCGGFTDGASVWLCSTDNNSRLAITGIDKYQFNNYIHFDEGYGLDRIEEHKISDKDIRAEGSALGNGNIILICVLSAIVVIAAVAMIIYSKKKKKGVSANADKEN